MNARLEQPPEEPQVEPPGWKILIVDDDEQVHHVTRLVLSDYVHAGRALHFISAFSGREARQLLREHEDVSVILLDVVMESTHAGLHLVRHIREELRNHTVRIVLRTGQPGQAPERRVIIDYDIDDYREKTELSAQKLLTSVVSSLRAYQSLAQLQEMNQRLEEQVAARTAELEAANRTLQRAAAELQAHRDRLQYENELAETVFAKIAAPQPLASRHLRHHIAPMGKVSGDIVLAAQRSDGGLYLMFGDFTGHGLSAALGALPVAEQFNRMTAKQRPLVEIIAGINDTLKEKLPSGLFLAACAVETDPDFTRLKVWNAGTPSALICSAGGGIRARIDSSDLPLGVVSSDRLRLRPDTVPLRRGDRLFIYSDGLVEARNGAGELFGEPRLEQLLATVDGSENAIERVLRALRAFIGEAPQSDDITLLELLTEPAGAGGSGRGP